MVDVSARRCDGDLNSFCGSRLMKALDEVVRQERAVRGGAEYPLDIRPMCCAPVERRQDAGKRTGEAFDIVGNHWKSESRKTRRVAVGVEDQLIALGR